MFSPCSGLLQTPLAVVSLISRMKTCPSSCLGAVMSSLHMSGAETLTLYTSVLWRLKGGRFGLLQLLKLGVSLTSIKGVTQGVG